MLRRGMRTRSRIPPRCSVVTILTRPAACGASARLPGPFRCVAAQLATGDPSSFKPLFPQRCAIRRQSLARGGPGHSRSFIAGGTVTSTQMPLWGKSTPELCHARRRCPQPPSGSDATVIGYRSRSGYGMAGELPFGIGHDGTHVSTFWVSLGRLG